MKQYIRNRIFFNHKYYIYLTLIIFGIIFYTTAIANHYYFRTFAFDYGTYNFMFWNYSHFHVNECPIYSHNSMTFFIDHFSFTLMYFIPIYWLLNWLTGTYTLLIIQTTLILLSGWVVYRLVIVKTGEVWLGLCALLYYFILQGRYSTFTGDVNIAVISACMVPFFIYFFETKRYLAASVIFILALFSRENMPLLFIFIMLILMIWHRKEKKVLLICLAYSFLSIIYFVLLFKFFIPLFEIHDKSYNIFNYSALGSNPSSAISFILHHPEDVFRMLFENHLGNPEFNGIKLEFYWVYLVSGGFILFYRPQYFIWFIPIVAQKMLNDNPIRWSIEWYYSIEVVTLLPIAVFIILAEIKSHKWKYGLAVAICILTLMMTINKSNPKHRKMAWWGTVKENIFDKNFFKSEFDVKKVHDYLKLIPSDAKVSANCPIIPQLAQRKNIYNFPKVADAEYIVLLTSGDNYYPLKLEQFTDELFKYLTSSDWNVLVNDNTLIILKKEHREVIKTNITYLCDAETLTKDNNFFGSTEFVNDSFVKNSPFIFSGGTARSDEFAHSGKYSIKLDKIMNNGMRCEIRNVQNDILYSVSVWRKNPKHTGLLVIENKNKGLWTAASKVIETDNNGWEHLQLNFYSNKINDLSVCVWQPDTLSTVYFDDLTITTNQYRRR